MWSLISFVILCFAAFGTFDISVKAILLVAAGLFAIADSSGGISDIIKRKL